MCLTSRCHSRRSDSNGEQLFSSCKSVKNAVSHSASTVRLDELEMHPLSSHHFRLTNAQCVGRFLLDSFPLDTPKFGLNHSFPPLLQKIAALLNKLSKTEQTEELPSRSSRKKLPRNHSLTSLYHLTIDPNNSKMIRIK
jgi:hypothetical protein